MNVMRLEEIKHEVAQKVFANTGYDWKDMLDNTAITDREIASRVRKQSSEDAEESVRRSYTEFFEEMLIAVKFAEEDGE